jgi:hypothetical protein
MTFNPDYALCKKCNTRLGEIIKDYSVEYKKVKADNDRLRKALLHYEKFSPFANDTAVARKALENKE